MSYDLLVFIHLLLFVFWLGGDVGVFVLGQQSRKANTYSLKERLTLLKVLTMVDMAPRTCVALMVPVSVTLAHVGGWWAAPIGALFGAWFVGFTLLWAAWTQHLRQGTDIAKTAKAVDFWLQATMIVAYGFLAVTSLMGWGPISEVWLATKTLLYALIFATSILIDVSYRPLVPALQHLIANEGDPEAEAGVLAIQNKTRKWVLTIYALLFAIGFMGAVKPF